MNDAVQGAAEEAAPAGKPTEAAVVKPVRYEITPEGGRKRTLYKPIMGHPTPESPTGRIESITLRRPRYRDIMNHGDPETLVVVEGGYVPQTDMGLIEKYIGTLSGIDIGLLEQLDYVDALALRDAVKSFFQ